MYAGKEGDTTHAYVTPITVGELSKWLVAVNLTQTFSGNEPSLGCKYCTSPVAKIR